MEDGETKHNEKRSNSNYKGMKHQYDYGQILLSYVFQPDDIL